MRTLAPIVAPIDDVLDSLLATLGLGVGEASVSVHAVRCSHPVLVG